MSTIQYMQRTNYNTNTTILQQQKLLQTTNNIIYNTTCLTQRRIKSKSFAAVTSSIVNVKSERRGSASELLSALTPCAVTAAATLTAAALLHTTEANDSSTEYADLLLPSSSAEVTPVSRSSSNGNIQSNGSSRGLDVDENGNEEDWITKTTFALRIFAMLFIIVSAILGNLLVIISVIRNRKLR